MSLEVVFWYFKKMLRRNKEFLVHVFHVKTPETMGEMIQFDENTDTWRKEVERTTEKADHFLLEDVHKLPHCNFHLTRWVLMVVIFLINWPTTIHDGFSKRRAKKGWDGQGWVERKESPGIKQCSWLQTTYRKRGSVPVEMERFQMFFRVWIAWTGSSLWRYSSILLLRKNRWMKLRVLCEKGERHCHEIVQNMWGYVRLLKKGVASSNEQWNKPWLFRGLYSPVF